MTGQQNKLQIETKKIKNKKRIIRSDVKKRRKKKALKRLKKKIRAGVLFLITFCVGLLLIVVAYAWFSVSLNVKVKFFDIVVSSHSGLFISLDGVSYFSSVEISKDSVITDLRKTYPNHTNQWASGGLWPASSLGIKNTNSPKFDMYVGKVITIRRKGQRDLNLLNTTLSDESVPNESNVYIAFDIFLKNVSGSPKPDNLYLEDGTTIDFEEDTDEETINEMTNIINSMRFGFVKIASVPLKTDVRTVQNLTCNNKCDAFIYEPNSISHTEASIIGAAQLGITLIDGIYAPTYAVKKEGERLILHNGHEGTGIPLDTQHFALQQTITDFDNPIYQIPNGITKVRIYVWLEGQDVDSLETSSIGADVYISIDLVKDLAGYEY